MKRFLSLLTIFTIALGITLAHADDKDKKTTAKKSKDACCTEMTSAKATKDAGCSEMTSAKSGKGACCAEMTSTKVKGTKSTANAGCCATGTKAKMSKEDCKKACEGMKGEKATDGKGTQE